MHRTRRLFIAIGLASPLGLYTVPAWAASGAGTQPLFHQGQGGECAPSNLGAIEGSVSYVLTNGNMSFTVSLAGAKPNLTYYVSVTCIQTLGSVQTDGKGNAGPAQFTYANWNDGWYVDVGNGAEGAMTRTPLDSNTTASCAASTSAGTTSSGGGAVACASTNIAAGAYSLAEADNQTGISFSAVTLDGINAKSSSATDSLTVTDATGSGSGWNVQLSRTAFTANGHTLAGDTGGKDASALMLTVASSGTPTGIAPSPGAGGVSAPAPSQPTIIVDAAAATGMGQSADALAYQLAIAPQDFAGNYSSTFTYSLIVGP